VIRGRKKFPLIAQQDDTLFVILLNEGGIEQAGAAAVGLAPLPPQGEGAGGLGGGCCKAHAEHPAPLLCRRRLASPESAEPGAWLGESQAGVPAAEARRGGEESQPRGWRDRLLASPRRAKRMG
jgi:hypothetical protein